MRIADMKARGEDVRTIVLQTLKEHYEAEEVPTGESWTLHEFFSVAWARFPDAATRRWLTDLVRHAPSYRRYPQQWVAGSLLGSAPGLILRSAPWFSLSKPLPFDLIMVCNQRLRLIDLQSQTVTVVQKHGFNAKTLQRDATLRSTLGPWPQVIRHSERTFVEPWLHGWSLCHLPPWRQRKRCEDIAWQQLKQFQAGTVKDDADERLDERLIRIHRLIATHNQFLKTPLNPRIVDNLHDLASPAATPSAHSHGDAQAGNIFVTKSGTVYWIDWEHHGRRNIRYDELTWQLQVRSGGDLLSRLQGALNTGLPALACMGRSDRRAALACHLLDEWEFYLQESKVGAPITLGLQSVVTASEHWVRQ